MYLKVVGSAAGGDFPRWNCNSHSSRDAQWVPFNLSPHIRQQIAAMPELRAAMDALVFKCDSLWAMLDALVEPYREHGHIPPGAFDPKQP